MRSFIALSKMLPKRVASVTALCGVLLGCSSGTGGTDALNQISSAFCSRAAACCNGVSQTCTNNVSSAYQSAGFNTSQQYTSSSVSQCVSEIQGLPCPGQSCVFTVPSDCPASGAALPILGNGGAIDAGTD
jgi:hypothetical protein